MLRHDDRRGIALVLEQEEGEGDGKRKIRIRTKTGRFRSVRTILARISIWIEVSKIELLLLMLLRRLHIFRIIIYYYFLSNVFSSFATHF